MSKRYKVKRFSSCYLMNWVDNTTNKELTALEIEEILHKQEKRIAELEAKLAESEKENKTLKDIRTLERVVPRNAQLHKLSNRDCYLKGFENAISETIRTFEETYGKEKCKLIEERNKYLMDIVKVGGYEYQIEELKQKLAEKEKEIAYLTKQVKKFNNEAQKYFEDAYCNDFHNQDKISFAVEVLKIAQDYVQQYVNNFDDMNDCLCAIDNQIKRLTHQHEDKEGK